MVSASAIAAPGTFPYPSERCISLLPWATFSHFPGYCLLTSFEALSSAFVPTVHQRDMVEEREEMGIKEQKNKY